MNEVQEEKKRRAVVATQTYRKKIRDWANRLPLMKVNLLSGYKVCWACHVPCKESDFYICSSGGYTWAEGKCKSCKSKRSGLYNRAKVSLAEQTLSDEELDMRKMLKRASSFNARTKARGIVGHISEADIRELFHNSGGRCFYCGFEFDEQASLDHIVPLSRGGEHSVKNLAVACNLCNARKHRRTPEEWLGNDWEVRSGKLPINMAYLIEPYFPV